jgi:tetratricopeptide (TPR) repeat protein
MPRALVAGELGKGETIFFRSGRLRNQAPHALLAIVLLVGIVLWLISPSVVFAQLVPPDLREAIEYHKAGKFNDAIEVYTEYLEKNPRYAEALNWRGMAYDDFNQLDKAMDDFNKAIEIKPDYADAYNNRGEVYRKQKKYMEAFRDYRKASELDKNFPEAHYNLALVYEEQKKHDMALREFSEYLRLAPNAPDKQQVTEKIEALKKLAPPPARVQAAKPDAEKKPGERKPAEPKPGERTAVAQKPGEKPVMPKPGAPPQIPVDQPIEIPGLGPMSMDSLMKSMETVGIVGNIVSLAIGVFCAVMLYLIATKTGTALPWLAFIPIANIYLMLKIAGKPVWWFALFFAPILIIPVALLGAVDPTGGIIVGILIFAIVLVPVGAWLFVNLGIAAARGKSALWGVLLFIPCTNPIALGYLGLSK